SINGQAIYEIINRIYPQLAGERDYFKNAKVEFWSFPRLFWQLYGEQSSFIVEIKEDDNVYQYVINSIPAADFEQQKDAEVLDEHRNFRFLDQVAYLKPGPFNTDASNSKQIFRDFIDAAFRQINEKKTKTLIIDLRNNGGQIDSCSDYLISYFATKPFKWYSKLSIKTSQELKDQTLLASDPADVFYKAILDHRNGETFDYSYDYAQPETGENKFTGKVYILINRQTYSMAAVAAATIQDYNFGTLVGEETGDIPTLYGSQFSYLLPNTGVKVKAPKAYIIRPNGDEKLEGVIPDILVKDHLLDEKDEILDCLLQIVKAK
ncbi:MAG: S41 family peptidase, partial [Leeuwenhoekiella sp.]